MFWTLPVIAAPPLELVGNQATPRSPIACEILVQDHDSESLGWRFRLSLSAPDAAGRSSVQRVTTGVPSEQVPSAPPPLPVVELDPTLRFVDQRIPEPIWAYVRPSHVDWSEWPLSVTFIAARVDAPTEMAAYTLSVNPKTEKRAWGSCVVTLKGPDVGGCTMLSDVRGTCLKDYAARHGLGAR